MTEEQWKIKRQKENEYSRNYYYSHRESRKKKMRDYYYKNIERIRAYQREYQREYDRKYYKRKTEDRHYLAFNGEGKCIETLSIRALSMQSGVTEYYIKKALKTGEEINGWTFDERNE